MQPDTRTALIDAATHLVRRRGYAAFSYADLADVIGIRKPSIHHHFPAKEDLGEALVVAYTERFAEALDAIDAASSDPIARLDAYAGPYRDGLTRNEGCLCGVLASEIAVLPARIQTSVRRFFALNLRWLEKTLEEGRSGLRPGIEPRREAQTILATLQGASFVALSLGNRKTFEDALAGLLSGLKGAGGGRAVASRPDKRRAAPH
jgi:TetR/AcrR family transcriptional regulator, transcriptional repressor for nem operon